jgi:hypothetical protein
MNPRKRVVRALAFCALGFYAAPSWAIISDNSLLYINQLVGATTFYNNGFTGTSAVVANIEAGFVWDQQEALTKDTVEFSDPSVTGQFDLHATAVGAAINANGSSIYSPGSLAYYIDQGIAYNSTLWSGAIATSWVSTGAGTYTETFTVSPASFSTPYLEALVSGVPQAGGATADVINSSWDAGNGTTGNDSFSLILDALINQSGKTLILSAGNTGPGADTVTSPAVGTNAIVVGAVTSDTSTPAYGQIASFSSVSPTDFFIPTDAAGDTGTTLTGVRARVDITAPGTDIVLPYYAGTGGGGQFGYGVADPPTNFIAFPFGGTSISAPIVSGGAALVVDAGKTLFPNDSRAIDGRIVKAILLNGASTPAGWNNGQTTVNGVVTTTQALDYSYGAGILNLTNAWTNYTTGTTDLVDSSGHPTLTGGNVQPTGWVFGQITHTPGATATVDYNITTPLVAGSELRTTLDWYSDELAAPDANYAANGLDATYGSFDNLDLSVYLTDGATPQLVATSDAAYESVQLLDFTLPQTGTYEIVVSENNYLWNFNGDTSTDFGLAWATSVPEPASVSILLLGGAALLTRRRRISPSSFNKGEGRGEGRI